MHKSNIALMGFVVLATILVCAYLLDPTRTALVAQMQSSGVPLARYFDLLIAGLIAVLGLFSILAGAELAPVVVIGTIGVFIVLTALQADLIRYMTFAALLFTIGMYGMVVSRNAVRVLMSIELMINAVNINLVAFSRYVDPMNLHGQVFAIFILTVAAAEAAVGLAIVLAIYRNMSTVDMEKFNLLKW